MNFEFSDEQMLFADAVRRFALDHLQQDALKRAHDPHFPFDVAQKMSAQGLMGITIPEADGGQGGTLMDAVIAIEQIAAVCPRSADVVQFGNFGPIRTFAEYGTPEQKARWLPDLLAGRMVMSLGMSEPDAGSAATELTTSARTDGAHYLLNGTKVFSTFSPDAAIFLIYVRFGPGIGGIGSVIVERGTPGFHIGPPSAFMTGEQWCELHFEDCRIPAENVLLGPGGFKKQMAGFNVERIGNAARSLAFGRYAFNAAREHVAMREQFGRPLCEFQGLQWKFAEMAIKLEAAQLLLYRAAANADRGLPSAYETAVAKAACNLAGFEVANEAVQAMGATRLQPRDAGRILHAPLPRLDDRRRLDRDSEEPHRRTCLRPPLRPASAAPCRRGGVKRPAWPRALLSPQSVAIVGQSDDAAKTAGRPLKYLRQAGSPGRVYPINPRRETVLGERAWPSLVGAAGSARARLYRHADRGGDRSGRGMRPARRHGRNRARRRLCRGGRRRRSARGAAQARSPPEPACASSARRASASSICATACFSPRMPPLPKPTCRSAASLPPRTAAA